MNPQVAAYHRYLIALHFPCGNGFLKVDFWNRDQEWRGARLLSNKAILDHTWCDDGIPAATITHQAYLGWFTSLIWGGFFKDRYLPLIERAAKEDPVQFRALINDAFGIRLGNQLLSLVRAGTPERSERLATKLRLALWTRRFARHPIYTSFGFLHHYIVDHLLLSTRAPSLTVAVIGPDGAGKSSVCSAISELPPGSLPFVGIEVEHLGRQLLPSLDNLRKGRFTATAETQVNDDPHSKTQHGPFLSGLRIIYFLGNAWLGTLWWKRFRVAPNRLYLSDRHMLEISVDPKRYRFGSLGALTRLAARLFPKPDITILLDVPTDVLQTRKQEVPFEETERQRVAYRQLTDRMPASCVVDASKPIESVVADVKAVILRLASERTARRLGRNESREVGIE